MIRGRKKVKPTAAAIVLVIIAAAFALRLGAYKTILVLSDAGGGEVYAEFDVEDGNEFSISFIHSVNNSPLTDVYQVRGMDIYVVRTIYYAFGAGVQTEIEEDQALEYGENGEMIVSGFDRRMERLLYIVSPVSDHVLTVGGGEYSLTELCGKSASVEFALRRRWW